MTRREWSETFYRDYFPEMYVNQQDETDVKCPFHDDSRASLSINLQTGLWCCHAGCGGGDEYDFYQRFHDCRYPQAERECTEKFGARPEREVAEPTQTAQPSGESSTVPMQLVDRWHEMLLRAPRVMDFLLNKRGLRPESIERFKLGWDAERITIPVFNTQGECINVRRYLPNAKSAKMVSYRAGLGEAVLYPVANLSSDTILLCEGEMDCILANQQGYNAMTATGGAGTWREEWNEMFKDKTVYICYDVDQAGAVGSDKVARKIYSYASLVKVIRLPIVDIKGGDVTNYFVDLGHTREDFDRLINDTLSFNRDQERPKQDGGIHEVHLSQASMADYHFKHIKMNVLVAGKDLAPYLIPKKVEVFCPCDRDICVACGLGIKSGAASVSFDADDRSLLQMIDCPDNQQRGIIRSKFGIPKTCTSFDLVQTEAQNVEEVSLIPELDFSSQEHEYVVRKAYYVGHGLGTNQSYVMTGVTVPDPWRQYATHIISEARPSQDNISNFKMNPQKYQRLQIFQTDDVAAKFAEIHEDFTHNITHIYGRNDVLTAIDLVYHSVLAFDFQGKRVSRGWVEALIIGDTRTGKSESAQSIMNHYKLGELVTGENTSYAGLIGGMQQTQKRWSITWGKIPLNDRRLIVLDEASGLTLDSISNMSGVRSSGVAEITKIQTERTHARTRLLWISNTRTGSPLSKYGFGIEAVQELIGKSEDICRFEFVVSCASQEVPVELINRRLDQHGAVPHKFTYDVCKELVLWAWSRRPEDVVFTDEALDLILQKATEMGRAYSSQIPLVEGANQRIKLARLAIAVACRVFSTDVTGTQVIVKPDHVEYSASYLHEIYRKQSLGYWDFSQQIKEQERVAVQARDKVMTFLTQQPMAGNLFMQHSTVTSRDMEDLCDLDRNSVRRFLQFLAKSGMISKTSNGYSKTPAFITILRGWKQYEA